MIFQIDDTNHDHFQPFLMIQKDIFGNTIWKRLYKNAINFIGQLIEEDEQNY